MCLERSVSSNGWEVQGLVLAPHGVVQRRIPESTSQGQRKITLLGQMRAKRAKICHFYAKIYPLEDICVLKSSQRKMHITRFKWSICPRFRAKGANWSLSLLPLLGTILAPHDGVQGRIPVSLSRGKGEKENFTVTKACEARENLPFQC